MGIKHQIFKVWVITIAIGLSGCYVVPRVSESQPYSEKCDLMTKKLTLSAEEMGSVSCGDESGLQCLGGVIVAPIATFFVSGSIVLVGNTAHWLEYQGRCESSELSQQIESFKKSFGAL